MKSIELRMIINPSFEFLRDSGYDPIGDPILIKDLSKYTSYGLLNELSTRLLEENLLKVNKLACWYVSPQQARVKDEKIKYIIVIGLKRI